MRPVRIMRTDNPRTSSADVAYLCLYPQSHEARNIWKLSHHTWEKAHQSLSLAAFVGVDESGTCPKGENDMSEGTEVNYVSHMEPSEGWYRTALDRVSSNLHHTVSAVGLSTPIEEFIDSDNHLIVRMDMPGMDPDDIEAKVRLGQLIIEGRRRHHDHGPRENLVRSEIVYGRLRRILPLPSWARNGDVQLSYQDGVLQLQLETDEETCPYTSVFKPKRVTQSARPSSGSSKAEKSKRVAQSA